MTIIVTMHAFISPGYFTMEGASSATRLLISIGILYVAAILVRGKQLYNTSLDLFSECIDSVINMGGGTMTRSIFSLIFISFTEMLAFSMFIVQLTTSWGRSTSNTGKMF